LPTIMSILSTEDTSPIDEQLLADDLQAFNDLFKRDSFSSADSKLPLELESINDELLSELQLLKEDWFLEGDASNEQLVAEEASLAQGLPMEIDPKHEDIVPTGVTVYCVLHVILSTILRDPAVLG